MLTAGQPQAGDLVVMLEGKGLQVKEGTNATMGEGVFVGGTITVATTAALASSRIFVTTQSPAGTVGAPYISARSAGTNFTITSTEGVDTSTVAWFIVEPAP